MQKGITVRSHQRHLLHDFFQFKIKRAEGEFCSSFQSVRSTLVWFLSKFTRGNQKKANIKLSIGAVKKKIRKHNIKTDESLISVVIS